MASVVLPGLLNVATEAFTAPLNKVCRLTGIYVVNDTAQDVVITIRDVFTPSVSNGVAAPVETTVNRKIIIADSNTGISWVDEMKSIKIIGECEVVTDDGANAVDVTVMWE